jgi:two-component system copper resistance phosphate regulon response regulator CusR
MKILLIEGDRKTAAYLQKGLTENRFVVDHTADGEDGLHLARTAEYDLIILSIALSKRDGLSVLGELRKSGNQTLVLLLTTRDALAERVRGLEHGADACLAQPIAFSELLATIRALLRRGPPRQPEVIRVADLEIDLVQRHATRGRRRLELTPKEFALLALLARRAGEALSRTLIAEHVWDMHFDSDTNVVDVHIRRLRAKIDDPFQNKLIQTIRGMGYALREKI